MATVTPGKVFASGETVTPAKLNNAATPTISAIQTADISDNQITTAKIVDANVTDAKLATGAVTGAAGGGKLAASSITAQTVIADALADTDEFLVHDASESALRKVAYSNIAPTVTASKLDGVAKDGSGNDIAAGAAPIFGCRAWAYFNGATSPPTILASGNVSGVTKSAAGNYTITFTTAMPDANYCTSISCSPGDQGSVVSVGSQTNTSVNVLAYNNPGGSGLGSALDGTIGIAVFR